MMRIDELTPELLEKAKKCESYEEKMAFISENEIELSDEQMEALSGGNKLKNHVKKTRKGNCPKCKSGMLERTGRTKPGKIFGDLWPDQERKCTCCGFTDWLWN